MKFNYFYGKEADHFNFLAVPMQLLTEPEFKELSEESILHYSRLLQRTSLSRENGWFDEQNRAFIIYSLDEMEETTGYSHTKCVRIMKELVAFGLIERKKRGQGKSDLIYVKDLIHPIYDNYTEDKSYSEIHPEKNSPKSENETSELHKNEPQGMSEANPNYIDKSNTEINYIKNNYNLKTDKKYNYSPLPPLQKQYTASLNAEEEEEKIKKQINYDRLVRNHSANKDLLSFILLQMVKMATETKSMVEISSGHSEPKMKVLERLKDITFDDIENLLLMLPDKAESTIKNPVGYIRKCLFNIVERRGAVCFTQQIKHKVSNGYSHHEYDFAELERIVSGG